MGTLHATDLTIVFIFLFVSYFWPTRFKLPPVKYLIAMWVQSNAVEWLLDHHQWARQSLGVVGKSWSLHIGRTHFSTATISGLCEALLLCLATGSCTVDPNMNCGPGSAAQLKPEVVRPRQREKEQQECPWPRARGFLCCLLRVEELVGSVLSPPN